MFRHPSHPRFLAASACAALALLAGAAAHAQCTGVKLTASDAASYDGFSNALAMDIVGGNPMAILGAPTDDTPEGLSAGSVYVFSRSGGSWSQIAKFFPSDLAEQYNFGSAVGFDDPYLIVGAPGVDYGAYTDSGAFYMYERVGSSWVNKGRYEPQYAGNGSVVGWSVGVTTANGGRAIIGAPGTTFDGNVGQPGNQNPMSGAAYLYERLADGTWGYITAITDYDAAGNGANQQLGDAVAIAGDVAVVAAPNGHAPGQPPLSGFVKMLHHDVTGWSIVGPTRLAAPDPQNTALFGHAVDTDGQYVAVSAINQASTAAQTPKLGPVVTAGCVYVYRWNSSTEQFDLDGQIFADDATSGMQLGGRVKVVGGRVFASSYSTHKVYSFRRLGPNNWVQDYVIKDPEPGPQTSFASDFAGAGDALIVNDASDTRGSLIYAGAAFAYTINNADAGSDSCAGARVVQAGTHTGCTTTATRDGFSTCGNAGTPGPDVWYSWTPRCSGNVIVDTIGSDYDTVLSIHSGCPDAGNSRTIECNDDASAPYSPASIVTFDYTAGTTYLIRIAGFNGAAGNYVLRINDYAPAPANNACASPATASIGGTYTWANCKATSEGPDSATACGLHMANDVWYRFTAPVAGTLALDTCGSNFDTLIALYASGVGCPSWIQELACNDDAPANSPCAGQVRTSYLTRQVQAGLSYMIRVGGYDSNNPVGDGVLHVNFAAACPCDWNLSGQVSVQDIFDFLQAYFAGNGDFNHSGATSVQDIFDFLSCYFAGCA